MNNGFSDALMSQPTLIPVGSPVWSSAVHLKEGDRVRFSGRFLPGSDYINEVSLTTSGSMADPEFLMHFISIEAE
jgi:hypothetical protein